MKNERMYKVGDTVTIREDLVVNNKYQGMSFVDEMEKYKGRKAIIKELDKTADDREIYLIDIDGSYWYWTAEMFEEGSESEIFKLEDLKTGMLVKTRDGAWHIVLDNIKQKKSNIPTKLLLDIKDSSFLNVENAGEGHKKDLTHYRYSDFDIIEIAIVDYVGDIFNAKSEIEKTTNKRSGEDDYETAIKLEIDAIIRSINRFETIWKRENLKLKCEEFSITLETKCPHCGYYRINDIGKECGNKSIEIKCVNCKNEFEIF